MGEVYSPERVSSGRIPGEDGMDQIHAAGLVMNHIRAFPTTSTHSRLIIPGSTATGQANRRSDVDYLLVDGSADLPDHRQQIQADFIGHTLRYASSRFNVRLEGQHCTERDIGYIGQNIFDAFWLAHALEVQDKMPDWSHRRPLEVLRPFAIGFDSPDTPQKVNLAMAIALRYMSAKITTFSEAGEFNSGSARDLLRFQRALEAPKALARKMLAVTALEGFELEDPDVTSKEDMKAQMEEVLARIDPTGRLKSYNDLLAELDAEYDEVLDMAAASGRVEPYERWLNKNYLVACALGLRLAQDYRWHIDGLTYQWPEINFWKYGLDVDGEVDDGFSLNSSLSEPMGDLALPAEVASESEISEAILISMDPSQIDAFLRNAAAAGLRDVNA